MAKLVFDATKLGVMIRQQRAGRTYQEIAEELGTVSAPTVYRLGSNHFPDMHVFTRICEWLNVSPYTFFIESDRNARTATYSQAKIVDLVCSDAALTPSECHSIDEVHFEYLSPGRYEHINRLGKCSFATLMESGLHRRPLRKPSDKLKI